MKNGQKTNQFEVLLDEFNEFCDRDEQYSHFKCSIAILYNNLYIYPDNFYKHVLKELLSRIKESQRYREGLLLDYISNMSKAEDL